MAMEKFQANGQEREGYLAFPETPKGKGLLLLHAWWGLTDFFKQTADQFAGAGFVVFAPDLHLGKTATTIDEANSILEKRNFAEVQATAEAGLHYLQKHPQVLGSQVSAIGFSMGAAYALLLDSIHPQAFDRIVLFYGGSEADLSHSKAKFQAHFGENDDWEPIEQVRQMQAANAQIYTYPGTGHWFVETNRPENYQPEAAELAWKRTLEFLGG